MWKKVISVFLIVCLLSTLVGCSGGNPVVPQGDEESGEDIIFIQTTNPKDNVLAVAGKGEGEAVAILGEKDAFGNPIKITGAVYTSEQGDAFIVDADNDGLPTYILDPTGNKIVFTNYTDSTVEISIYNSNNELIEGPTTITVDPSDLITLKQLYSSVDSKNKDVVDVIVVSVLKWGGFSLNWAACVVAVCSSIVPAILSTCGSALLSTLAMFTQNDADNIILSTIGVLQCNDVYYKPWKILACVGSITSFISQIVDSINQSDEGVVSNVVAISWTDHIPENSQNIEHLINVFWDPYPVAGGYKVYRNVNGVVEGEPVYSGPGELLSDKNVVQWHDTNIIVGNTYSYYVTAYGDGRETAPSQETGTIYAFLPPIYLVSPSAGDTINNSTPTFEWSPVGSNPEGCKNFGTTELWVKDLTADKELVWQIVFDDMTTFSATYNQDGQASPLIPGHSYGWQVTSYGYAENMEDAISQSEYWEFTYTEGE